MKKILFLLILTLVISTSKGQVSFGNYTTFPDSKLFGLAYKPQLAIGKLNDTYVLSLRYVSPEAYASFDEESVLLLKFNTDTTIKLPIVKEIDVVKKYENSYSKYGTSHFYITYSVYFLDDDVLNFLIDENNAIKKIRASFTNGNVLDWEIKDNYQPKLTKGLITSYQQVETLNAKRKEKIDDVEAGF